MTSKQKPLLIVSNALADGMYTALLLSNHLQWPGEAEEKRPFTEQDNYFVNEALVSLFNEDQDKLSDKETLLRLQLILEEGFDSMRRYGALISLSCYRLIQRYHHLPEAISIFICDTSLLESSDKNQPEWLIPAQQLIAQPELVLQQCSTRLQLNTVFEEKVKAQAMKDDAYWLRPQTSKLNFLYPESVAVFFCLFEEISTDRVIARLKALYCAYPRCEVTLCCNSSEQSKTYQLQIQKTFHTDYAIHCEVATTCTTIINKHFAKLTEQPLLVDTLRAEFNYADLFHSELFSIAMPMSEEKTGILDLNTICSTYQLDCAVYLNQTVLTKIQTLDPQAGRYYVLFDALLAYAQTDSAIHAVPAILEKDYLQVVDQKTVDAGYQHVLAKGRTKDTTKTNSLHSNVIKLKTLLSHTNQELHAVQELSAQLHQRIHFLENNWYYKLRHKLQRYRKIFFKKKTPGKDGAKRILQFLRFTLSKAGFGILRKVLASVFKKLFLLFERRPVQIIFDDNDSTSDITTYHDWIQHKLDPETLKTAEEKNPLLETPKPLISILMPVYNPPVKFLKEAIESVIKQRYTHWELCIADDCSTQSKVTKLLQVYAAKDPRIKVHFRKTNGHISATSNDALDLCTGEFVLFMDHDDLLTTHCIEEVVRSVQQHPTVDIVYSDEDKIDEAGHHQQAHFKPDWSPDNLLSRNYFGHVTVVRRTLIHAIGGFRIGFEGSQDYDLLLRATEQTRNIHHIPKVLYHWRIHGSSAAQSEAVKPYAYMAAKRALEETLQRRNLKGDVKYLSGLRGYRIDYAVTVNDKVSIIIPTKDQVDLLKNTVDSIIEKTTYRNYEIIVLNNNSSSTAFQHWVKTYTEKYSDILSVHDASFPFNFSKLMNLGAQFAKGNLLLLLNNDVEITQANWLTHMVSYAAQQRIGAVGAKLLYPDDTIQHAGVIIGLGGIAGHAFVGSYKDDPGYFNYIQCVNNFSALTAACLMIRKSVFDEVGGMNETFEVEYNDVDFCLRVKEAGYDNVYLPQVELYHYESATRGHPHQNSESYKRHLKEMELFRAHWQKYIDHDPHYNPNLNYGAHDFRLNFSA